MTPGAARAREEEWRGVEGYSVQRWGARRKLLTCRAKRRKDVRIVTAGAFREDRVREDDEEQYKSRKGRCPELPLHFSGLFLGHFVAGWVGALTGLGGGVVLIPLLTLGFHVDLRYAIGASLISVIATSSGAAAAYVREG